MNSLTARIGLFFAALTIDRMSKLWALASLLAGKADAKFFSFGLKFNKGVSFSLLEGTAWGGWAAGAIGVCILAFVTLHFKKLRGTPALPLLWAGALGNLADRFMYGYVIDWFYVGVYINFADVSLCLGALFALLAFSKNEDSG